MKIFLLLLLSVCIGHANAQQTAELYQAEIIVFKQIEADTAIDEIRGVSRPQASLHQKRAALDLHKVKISNDIQAVSLSQLQLNDEVQKIKHHSQYELLYHGAWQQPPYHRAEAPYINILDGPQNGLLKSTAWLSYERYFKLLLNFQYDPEFDETSEVVDIPQASPIFIRLERTLSEKKLFYLDHPVIGVIALISPIENAN